jgi:hypothetical protein
VAAPPSGVLEAWPHLEQAPLAAAETLPLWAVPALDVGPRPLGPSAAHLAKELGAVLDPPLVAATGSAGGPMGRGPSLEPVRW